MPDYELRLLTVAGETRKRYRLRCEDDAAAKLRIPNCGDLRFRFVELWRERKLLYEGARVDAIESRCQTRLRIR
jgi:hypothetical protein